METKAKTRTKKATLKKRLRIPVSKIYFKKGEYKELVEDPFYLAK